MSGRIQGVFIIVNTLLVPLVALAFAALAGIYGAGIQQSWSALKKPLQSLASQAEASAEQIGGIAAKTEAELALAATQLSEAANAASNAATAIAAPITALNAVTVPTLQVGSKKAVIDLRVANPITGKKNPREKKPPLYFEISVPTVSSGSFAIGATLTAPFQPIGDALTKLAAPVAQVERALDEVEKLKRLQPALERFQTTARQAARAALALADRLLTLGKGAAIAMGLLLVWFALGYGFWAARRLRRGLALLRGEGVPPQYAATGADRG